MKYYLHIDNAHPNLDKRFTIHKEGCQHANLGRGKRGGGAFQEPVTVIVVRRKEPCCTCGEAQGKRPEYLAKVCAYCDKEVKLYA